jgi:hypothetical protein
MGSPQTAMMVDPSIFKFMWCTPLTFFTGLMSLGTGLTKANDANVNRKELRINSDFFMLIEFLNVMFLLSDRAKIISCVSRNK